MKIIASCNNNPTYFDLIIPFINHHKRILPFCDVKVIYVDNELPMELEDYKENIIFFKQNDKCSTKFQSQHLRLFYPALFTEQEEHIIICDIDVFIMSDILIKLCLQNIECDAFNIGNMKLSSCLKERMLPFFYTIIKPKVIKEVLDINNLNDIHNKLEECWIQYNQSWFSDQYLLFNEFYLKNKIKKIDIQKWYRLDRANGNIKKHPERYFPEIKRNIYLDFHSWRGDNPNDKQYLKVIDLLTKQVSVINDMF